MSRPEAILLIGPTSSGKTPLGELLQKRGFHGRRCAHFDFGAHLRNVARCDGPRGRLSAADVALVAHRVDTGTLLEDDEFHVARDILLGFLDATAPEPDTLIVLNGLPRHIGQAAALDALLDVRLVVSLTCEPGTVTERIRLDSGGDRCGRVDDTAALVARKLQDFHDRTAPLVSHYIDRDVPTAEVRATADSDAVTAHTELTRVAPRLNRE